MPKRTRLSAKTSAATRCRIGSATSRNGWRRSSRRWRRWRRTPSWRRRKSVASRPKRNSSANNAQAAVDAGAQIIVAHELTQCGNDQGQLMPLVEAIENNLGRKPEQASADSGYCSETNLEALEVHGIDGYVAPGRAKHPTAANGKIGGPLTQRMRKKIDDGGFETPYRLRKQVVEPVFGQIKQARGFRQFLLRGVEKVRAEWAMICTAHNLLKLFTLANAASAG